MHTLQIINNIWVPFNVPWKNKGTKWYCDSCLFERAEDWVAMGWKTGCPDVPPSSFK